MKKIMLGLSVVIFVGIFSGLAAAQASERIKFPRGSTGTAVLGVVRGYAYHDYIIRVSRGQTIEINLVTTASPSVFTVFGPDGSELTTEMDDFSGEVPVTGDYKIRVLMMRSEARRKNSVSHYTLKVSAH